MEYSFYKATPLYKELQILDLIEKNKNITQRQMSDVLGSSVAMTNNYLSEIEERGLLEREYISTKEVIYHITDKGKERRKHLSVIYLSQSQKMYDGAKEELLKFVEDIKKKGFKKILLYGAGEVAEIFLNAIKDEIEVLAVIDDDHDKQGKKLVNKLIISRDEIVSYKYDGILISSYGHQKLINQKIKELNIPKEKIITFFGELYDL
ncbi:MAG: winged helix-turn-helix transcriptional regulator [Acholeplasmatales bacterium]